MPTPLPRWLENCLATRSTEDKKYRGWLYYEARYRATPAWTTPGMRRQIADKYKQAAKLSETGASYVVDHIVPLNGGDQVSGLHVPWNMQVIRRTVNIAKSNKQWPGKLVDGFLRSAMNTFDHPEVLVGRQVVLVGVHRGVFAHASMFERANVHVLALNPDKTMLFYTVDDVNFTRVHKLRMHTIRAEYVADVLPSSRQA